MAESPPPLFRIVEPEPQPEPQPAAAVATPDSNYVAAVLTDAGELTVLSDATPEGLQSQLRLLSDIDSIVVVHGVRLAVTAKPTPAFWVSDTRYPLRAEDIPKPPDGAAVDVRIV